MASNPMKLTIYVTNTANGQQMKIRGVGGRGSISANLVNNDAAFQSQSPFDTVNHWATDVLNKALTMVPTGV